MQQEMIREERGQASSLWFFGQAVNDDLQTCSTTSRGHSYLKPLFRVQLFGLAAQKGGASDNAEQSRSRQMTLFHHRSDFLPNACSISTLKHHLPASLLSDSDRSEDVRTLTIEFLYQREIAVAEEPPPPSEFDSVQDKDSLLRQGYVSLRHLDSTVELQRQSMR